MTRHRCVVASVVLFAVLVATAHGAGSATTKPLKQWTAAICSSFARWQQQIAKLSSAGPVGSLLHGAGGPTDPEAIRLGIPVFLGDVLAATQKLAHDVVVSGVPKTKNGAAIATSFDMAVGFLIGEFSAFKTRAEALGPNQPGPQFSESEDLPSLLQSAGATLPTVVRQAAVMYPTGGLTKAFMSSKACRPLL
jgi:hypothetical protein